MVKNVRAFLKDNNCWPLSNLQSFDLIHGDRKHYENNINKIRSQVQKKGGLYVYKKGKEILYVGKANSLFGRLKSHCRESFERVPGDSKWNTWHKFFSSNKGTVTIYWKEVKGETERQLLEKCLQYVLDPVFEPYRRRIEGRKQ